jgi:agmatinase
MTTDAFDPDAPSAPGFFGLDAAPDAAAVVIVPVPFDATTSYRRGTAAAPDAVREASGQVDLHDLELGDFWRAGIAEDDADASVVAAWNDEARALADTIREAEDAGEEPPADAGSNGRAGSGDAADMLESAKRSEAGSRSRRGATDTIADAIARVDALGDAVERWVGERTEAIFARGAVPAILGGDHSVPLGAIRGALARHERLGILHVDAHADFREAYEGFRHSHASIMYNVSRGERRPAALVQVGIRDVGRREWATARATEGVRSWTDPEVAGRLSRGDTWAELVREMLAPLPQDVWVSFDIDGLEPALAPNTGTPVPGGLTWHQATQLLALLGESGRRIVGFDLCEVGTGEIDAIVGARLLYKLCGWSLRHRG